MTKRGHLGVVSFFLVGAIAVTVIADRAGAPWGARFGGIAFFVLGVVFSERHLLWRWVVNLIRVTNLFTRQEGAPEEFVKLVLEQADLYPDHLKPKEAVPYVRLWFVWDNRSFVDLAITDIRGDVSIEGHSPHDSLPPNIPDVKVEGFQPQKAPDMAVNLSGDGLEIIQRLRQRGFGKANIAVKVNAKVNGRPASYEAFHTAFYVG